MTEWLAIGANLPGGAAELHACNLAPLVVPRRVRKEPTIDNPDRRSVRLTSQQSLPPQYSWLFQNLLLQDRYFSLGMQSKTLDYQVTKSSTELFRAAMRCLLMLATKPATHFSA